MKIIISFICIAFVILTGSCKRGLKNDYGNYISDASVRQVQDKLIRNESDKSTERIRKGTSQLAKNWRKEDGSNDDYIKFCLENYVVDSLLLSNFQRIQRNLEIQNGYLYKIRFWLNESESFTGINEVKADEYFRKAIPESNPYKEKLAFFIQLNFPFYSLDEKRSNAGRWDREKWAMVRLGDLYAERLDPGFKPAAAEETKAFEKYMSRYFFRMDHISLADGSYPFDKPLTLNCHHGLRDNLKGDYTRPGGLARQEITGKLVEHITAGSVPVEFLQDTSTRWNPWSNKLFRFYDGKLTEIEFQTEGTKRYAGLLSEFRSKSSADKLYSSGSTYIKRTFDSANLTEEEVEGLIRDFLSDPVIASVGKLIAKRLGRPLQPFDIWYSGFQSQSAFPASMLDSITRSRYPDPAALQKDVPLILMRMGIDRTDADYIGRHTIVRPIVSGGYSDQPPLRGDTSLMTTVFNPAGLDFKAFRVSMHELGHVVCGVYTTKDIDNFILADVPSSGITEGMAELLAFMNADGLGLKQAGFEERKELLSLAALWYLVDIGGQSLTEIETWKWMYLHPKATAGELQSAVMKISEEIWNKYYSTVFGGIKDQHILSIYNHFITGSMYLFNYFIGDVVMFQLYNAYMPDNLTAGLKKACLEGQTLPELWMTKAVGDKLSLKPLMETVRKAVVKYDSSAIP